MSNLGKATPDRLVHIRAYLEKKSKKELVILLLNLVQGMDEPTPVQPLSVVDKSRGYRSRRGCVHNGQILT